MKPLMMTRQQVADRWQMTGLSIKASRALAALRIETFPEMRERMPHIRMMSGLGKTTIREIERWLEHAA